MQGYEKTSNFLTSFFICILASIIILLAGFKVIQYSNQLKFYTRFLLKWEQSLTMLSSKDIPPAPFTGSNHAQYMEQLASQMKTLGIQIPESNSNKPFLYRIPGIGTGKRQDIFLLGLEHKIVLFGLSKTTANMLDKKIDKRADLKNGQFTGKQQTNSETYTGIWTL